MRGVSLSLGCRTSSVERLGTVEIFAVDIIGKTADRPSQLAMGRGAET